MNGQNEDSRSEDDARTAVVVDTQLSPNRGVQSRFKPLITITKLLIIAAIFFYIIRYLNSNWDQLKSLNIHLNYGYVLLSFIAMKLAWVTTAWSWGKTLEAFGYKLRYRDIYTIYFRSMPAKYLPGKVWQLAGSTYVAAQKGVPEGANIGSFLIGQAYSVLSGVALIIGALVFGVIKKSGQDFAFFRWTAIPILIILIILIIRPVLMERMMNLVLPIFKRQKVNIYIKISTSLWLFLAFLIPWFIFGLSFWLLVHALVQISFSLFIPLTVILTAGTVIGFLAIFAPGGIGVKEASIAALAASIISFPATLALAIGLGYRIITSIVELIAFGITWLISPPQKSKS
jgi:glycosyltransferase 2 family protein